jgi:hypothetical protein
VESFTPPILQHRYNLALEQSRKPLVYTWNPINANIRQATDARHYLTGCEVDLMWLIALPIAFGELLSDIDTFDPYLRQQGLLFPELWTFLPVVGFEIETSVGKHAAGGFLNLATHSLLGTVAVETKDSAERLDAKLKTYRSTLGLRNLYIKAISAP